MDKIISFTIDHDHHDVGLYLSHVEHGIYTYDLRMKTPNGGDYISPKAIHTIEHILATLYRNSAYKEDIVYFGPMGCRTGCYLLMREVGLEETLILTIDMLTQAILLDTIPGSSRVECGNYLEHDLPTALREMRQYLEVLLKQVNN